MDDRYMAKLKVLKKINLAYDPKWESVSKLYSNLDLLINWFYH